MTKQHEVYKCNICGNIIEVIHESSGQLVCCGQVMERLEEQTADMATEKHVPIKTKTENGVTVKVGSTKHPMEEKHYIEWVQVLEGNMSARRFLKPGEEPEGDFCCVTEAAKAREFCNVHGLWKS